MCAADEKEEETVAEKERVRENVGEKGRRESKRLGNILVLVSRRWMSNASRLSGPRDRSYLRKSFEYLFELIR